MAVNMAAQDKLLELFEAIIEGRIDHLMKLWKAYELAHAVQESTEYYVDAINAVETESMPAEKLTYMAFKVIGRTDDKFFGNKKSVFTLDYYINKYEKDTQRPFEEAINANDNWTQEQKEEFLKYIEENRDKEITASNIGEFVRDMEPYMNERNAKGFEANLKKLDEIKEQYITEDKNGDKKVLDEDFDTLSKSRIKDLMAADQNGKNEFLENMIESDDEKAYASDILKLQEYQKKGGSAILAAPNTELNDMSFAAVELQGQKECRAIHAQIVEKYGVKNFLERNSKLGQSIPRSMFAFTTAMDEYNIETLMNGSEKQINDIKQNIDMSKTTETLKSERYLKTKEQEIKEKNQAEVIKAEQEKKERINNIVENAEKENAIMNDNTNVSIHREKGEGTRLKNEAKFSLENIKKARNDLISKDVPVYSVEALSLLDVNNEKDKATLINWAEKAKEEEINNFTKANDSISVLYPEAKEAEKIVTHSFRERRANAVKNNLDNSLANLNEQNVKEREEILKNENGILSDRISSVLNTNNIIISQRQEFKEGFKESLLDYENGKINAVNMCAVDIFVNKDVDKLKEFIKTAPQEEVQKAIDNMDYIYENELMGVSKTYELVDKLVMERNDANKFEFRNLDKVLPQKEKTIIDEKKKEDRAIVREISKNEA